MFSYYNFWACVIEVILSISWKMQFLFLIAWILDLDAL